MRRPPGRQRHRTPTPASGNNWAAGGARRYDQLVGGFGYTPSLMAQYQAYSASGHAVDPHALYTVGRGANDMFAVQANPSQAAQIISGAVTAQVGLVGALTQAGAQYILVPTCLPTSADARRAQAVRIATAWAPALANDCQHQPLQRVGRQQPAGDPDGHLPPFQEVGQPRAVRHHKCPVAA